MAVGTVGSDWGGRMRRGVSRRERRAHRGGLELVIAAQGLGTPAAGRRVHDPAHRPEVASGSGQARHRQADALQACLQRPRLYKFVYIPECTKKRKFAG